MTVQVLMNTKAGFTKINQSMKKYKSSENNIIFKVYENDNQINENLLAIKKYNIALEIKKLEKEIKEEVDFERQIKLMEEIRTLKTKEGKSW